MNKFLLYIFLAISAGCTTTSTTTTVKTPPKPDPTEGVINEKVFHSNIRTIQFYPVTGITNPTIHAPVVPMSEAKTLMLEFDELGDNVSRYIVRFVNCTYDWKKSQLNDIEFLSDYNEFQITRYKASFNTRTNYTHYEFSVPSMKKSGNYALVVAMEDDPEDIVMIKRFCLFENKVLIEEDLSLSPGVGASSNEQLIQFNVTYKDFMILNPYSSVYANLRQNQRWNTMRQNVPHTFLNEGIQQIVYKGMTMKNKFDSGNEFRKVDIRSTQFNGFNVEKVRNQDSIFQVVMRQDQFNLGAPHVQWEDINGQYTVDHYEFGNGDIEADYVNLFFRAGSEKKYSGDVYVFGAITDWQIDPRFMMRYYPEGQEYSANIKLKQGYYNYKYVAFRPDRGINEIFLDGNHYETENQYEIFFYYNPPGEREHLLVGYKKLDFNKR